MNISNETEENKQLFHLHSVIRLPWYNVIAVFKIVNIWFVLLVYSAEFKLLKSWGYKNSFWKNGLCLHKFAFIWAGRKFSSFIDFLNSKYDYSILKWLNWSAYNTISKQNTAFSKAMNLTWNRKIVELFHCLAFLKTRFITLHYLLSTLPKWDVTVNSAYWKTTAQLYQNVISGFYI